MIKRTLYFNTLAYLKTKEDQLFFEINKSSKIKTAPIEAVHVVTMKHRQIAIAKVLLAIILFNNAIIAN